MYKMIAIMLLFTLGGVTSLFLSCQPEPLWKTDDKSYQFIKTFLVNQTSVIYGYDRSVIYNSISNWQHCNFIRKKNPGLFLPFPFYIKIMS